MRKAVLALFGATALTVASAASATVTVNPGSITGVLTTANGGSVTVANPSPGYANIGFGNNTTPVGTTASNGFTFNNDLTGLYNITISDSSYPTLALSNVMFAGQSVSGSGGLWSLFGVTLNAGTNYGLTFSVNNTGTTTGTFNGNISITPLPEPATWAMMLLGFGAIGLTLRSRRKPVLAQIA